jgi:hypothetical protein
MDDLRSKLFYEQKNGYDLIDTGERIDAQRPDDYFREHCDAILENNQDEATFIQNINKLLEERLHHG